LLKTGFEKVGDTCSVELLQDLLDAAQSFTCYDLEDMNEVKTMLAKKLEEEEEWCEGSTSASNTTICVKSSPKAMVSSRTRKPPRREKHQQLKTSAARSAAQTQTLAAQPSGQGDFLVDPEGARVENFPMNLQETIAASQHTCLYVLVLTVK